MKIVVLAGGISSERDVSLTSGSKIFRSLKKNNHQAILLDVYLGYEGTINRIFEKEYDWAVSIQGIKEENPSVEEIKAMRGDAKDGFFGPNVLTLCKEADMVFMALHGEDGENGKIQAAFDLLGICYTGNDYLGCALAMDKGLAKELFAYYEIPTPKGICLKKGETDTYAVSLPSVIKTSCGGSSVGVYIVYTLEEYEEAKQKAFALENEVVIEEYIKGREFAIGVMGGKALPIIEIVPVCGFYDYKNKYQPGGAVETCPADLSQDITCKMQAVAERVYQALRLTTYARMDFLLKDNGDFYCLEANTLPGMTPMSLLPQEAAAIGISYEALCEKIMELSRK